MFEIGKIPPEILERIVLNPIIDGTVKRKDVILRPKTGEDCCGVAFEDEICLLSADPITGAGADIGYLAVQINCNDIFSSGGEPVGILLTVLLPLGSDETILKEIMDGALRGARELGIEILGGHTEVSDALCKPLISATVVGKTKNRKVISTGGGKIGQDVVMSKWAGTEGTAIVATEYEEILLAKGMKKELIENGKSMKKFLSVGKESMIAMEHGVSAMHDATEGGILGAVWEMAECANLGISIIKESILIREETRQICKMGNIDPLRFISSGTMIMIVDDGAGLVKKLEGEGIAGAVIGKVTGGSSTFIDQGVETLLTQPKSDALYEVNFH